MMSPRSPSFLNAYLVAENSMGALPVGVVRKDGNVWRILPVADRARARNWIKRRAERRRCEAGLVHHCESLARSIAEPFSPGHGSNFFMTTGPPTPRQTAPAT